MFNTPNFFNLAAYIFPPVAEDTLAALAVDASGQKSIPYISSRTVAEG